jgi:hypothetical protein
MANTPKSPALAPAGVKTNRKLLKVLHAQAGDSKGELSETRYFDFSIHAERTEFVKLTSWALKADVTMVVIPVYVE